jgi:hypothetical protein
MPSILTETCTETVYPDYDVRKIIDVWKYPTDDLLSICAHRGASHGGGTENSLTAIKKAALMGWEAVEIDLRLTKDGKVVVWHDNGLGRATNVVAPRGEVAYNPFVGKGYNPLVKDTNWVGGMENLCLRDDYGNVTYVCCWRLGWFLLYHVLGLIRHSG